MPNTFVVSINGRPYARFVRVEHAIQFIEARAMAKMNDPYSDLVPRLMRGQTISDGAYTIEPSNRKAI